MDTVANQGLVCVRDINSKLTLHSVPRDDSDQKEAGGTYQKRYLNNHANKRTSQKNLQYSEMTK
jgi:hypothetical protein